MDDEFVLLPLEEAIRRLEEMVKSPKWETDPLMAIVDATLLDMIRDGVVEVAVRKSDGELAFRLKES